MVELVIIGLLIIPLAFVYVYFREKNDQNEKLPFDKHLGFH
jgi:hypothetical protein